MFNLFRNKAKVIGDENLVETTLKISGMHCPSCAMSIDVELEEAAGVSESTTSYKRSEATVKYNPEIIDKKKLIEIVEGLDYQAK